MNGNEDEGTYRVGQGFGGGPFNEDDLESAIRIARLQGIHINEAQEILGLIPGKDEGFVNDDLEVSEYLSSAKEALDRAIELEGELREVRFSYDLLYQERKKLGDASSAV